jgi:tetratricopeptide (TPR) repeat protein
LPATPTLRREEIRLQVALITPLLHIKGYAAPETQAATERARVLIEQAEALGERLEDPLLLLSVVYSFWVAKFVAFNGDTMRDFAGYFQGLAEKQETPAPKMIAHRIVGTSLLLTGDIREGRAHLDRTLTSYDPAEHRQLATRFGQDVRVSALCYRALGLWMLGNSEAALADTNRALKDAREIGQAASLMFMLSLTSFTHIFYGDYAVANALADELISSADEKGALYWKAQGMSHHGCVLALTGKAAAAVQMISCGTAAWRSTGATLWTPLWLSYLGKAYADLEKFEDAWRCMEEAKTAVATTKERWYEAELYRMAGEIGSK